MTDRKVADVLLGGQPKTDTPPVGAPSETRMLGRGEAVAAETVNRGTYAVALEVDKVFSELQRLSRKAVTVNGQQTYAVGTVTNVFDDPNTDNLNPYVGSDPGSSPDGLFQVLQPGAAAAYEESVEGAFTVYANAPTVADPIVFQARMRGDLAYAGPVEIRFVAGGVLAVTTTAAPDRITVTYAPADDYDAVATAINLEVVASTWVEAVGDVGVVVSAAGLNPSILNAGAFVALRAQTSVDADVIAVLIDDPVVGDAVPTPDIAVVERTAANQVTLRTAISGGGAIVAGDYLIFSINGPTQFMTTSGSLPTGRYQAIKVATGSTPASVATDVITLESDLTLISTLGFLDAEVRPLLHRYKARFWAAGHSHSFDIPGTPVNPRTFMFGETDNVHWYQTINSLPSQEFLDVRIATFKSKYADPADLGDSYLTFTDDLINDETLAPAAPVAVTAISKLHVLIRPRLSGDATLPPLSFQELRFVFDSNLVTPVGVVSLLSSTDGDFSLAVPVICDLEKLENVPGGSHYRLDPFTAVLPDSNLNQYYKIVFTSNHATETAKLKRIYFSGNHGASPILRSKSASFTFSDVELWVVHDLADPVSGIVGLTADLYQSTNGAKDSFVRIKQAVTLTLSHLVASGPYRKVYAYRAQMFPETYDLPIGTAPEWFLAVNVNQTGTPDTHRRIINALLVESQRNGVGELTGAFIGANMADNAIDVPGTPVRISVSDSVVAATGPSTFTDASVVDFTTDPVGPNLAVAVGDWLVIESGVNAGNHRITARTATVLTLATPTSSWTAHAATTTSYRIVRATVPLYPAGIEGASKSFRLITNVDIQGIAGDVDFGFGQYAKFRDIPPDGLRAGAGSFGDTGFLAAKVAAIMGTSINDSIPVDRTLVGLDARIDALETVTVGLGTISPLSFGQFNVTDYASVRLTILAAVAALPNGGTILFKPGAYGMGAGTNIFTETTSDLIIDTPGITLQAQAPGTVTINTSTFGGGAGTRGWTIKFRASNCGIRGIKLASSHFTADTLTAPQNAVWFSSELAAIENLVAEDIVLYSPAVPAAGEGRSRVLVGYRDPGNFAHVANSVTNVRLVNVDATAITAIPKPIAVYVDETNTTTGVASTPGVRGLYLRGCRVAKENVTSSTAIQLATAQQVVVEDCVGRVELYWCVDVRVNGSIVNTLLNTGCISVHVSDSTVRTVGALNAVSCVRLNAGSPARSTLLHNNRVVESAGFTVGGSLVSLGANINSFALIGGSVEATGVQTQVVSFGDFCSNIHVGGFTATANVIVRYSGTLVTAGAVYDVNIADITVDPISGVPGSPVYAIWFDVVAGQERVTGLRIRNVQFTRVPSAANLYGSRVAVRLNRIRNSVISGLSVKHTAITAAATENDLSVEISDSDRVLVSDSILSNSGNFGTIVETVANTNLVLSNVIKFDGDAFLVPPGQHYAAVQRVALTDGQEIAKFGIGATTTLRMWRMDEQFFITQNISSFAAPAAFAGTILITQETPAFKSSVLLVGPGKVGMFTANAGSVIAYSVGDSFLDNLSPSNVYTGGVAAGNANAVWRMLAPAIQFAFGNEATPAIRIEQFDNGVVLTSNLAYKGASKTAWNSATGWHKSVIGSAAFALVMQKASGSDMFRLIYVPAATALVNASLTATALQGFTWNSNGATFFNDAAALSELRVDANAGQGALTRFTKDGVSAASVGSTAANSAYLQNHKNTTGQYLMITETPSDTALKFLDSVGGLKSVLHSGLLGKTSKAFSVGANGNDSINFARGTGAGQIPTGAMAIGFESDGGSFNHFTPESNFGVTTGIVSVRVANLNGSASVGTTSLIYIRL